MMDFFFVHPQLLGLILELGQLLGQLHTAAGIGICNPAFQIGNGRAITSLLLMHIVGTDTGNGVFSVAMHIDQRFEAVLLAAVKQPVNGAFLINLAMVSVKEIVPNDLLGRTLAAQRIGDKFQIFVQCVLAVDRFHELHEPTDNIIFEILIITDRDDVVAARDDGLVLAGVPFAARVGKPLHVQRIPPKHTAHGIGDEGDDLVAHGADIARALHRLRHIVLTVKHTMHGHILVRHIRRQFILQTVNVNENAVEFFFVYLKILKALFAFIFPCIIVVFQSSHIFAAILCSKYGRNTAYRQRIPLEIP